VYKRTCSLTLSMTVALFNSVGEITEIGGHELFIEIERHYQARSNITPISGKSAPASST